MRRIRIGSTVVVLALTTFCSGATFSSDTLARGVGKATHSLVTASRAVRGDLFTYSPAVSNVSPNSGPVGGGTAITVTGSGFVQGDTVVIGQGHGPGAAVITATAVSVASSTQITATTGGGAQPGMWNLFVIAPSGAASHAASGDKFTYTPPVTLTVLQMSPSSGPVGGGTPLTITGTGFAQGDTVVIGQGNGAGAGAIAATRVSVISSTQITATTGGGAQPGTWALWVMPPGGSASQAVGGPTFTYTSGSTSSATTVTPAANNVPYYAPFQSHNNRIVYADGAIFMSYVTNWDGGYNPGNGTVIVVKSTDNGATWTQLLSIPIEEHVPASLEVDSAGNVYAFMVSNAWTTSPFDGWEWDARMYMLPKASNYLCGSTCASNYLELPKGNTDAKFATTYIPATNQLVYQNNWRQFKITASDQATASADPVTAGQQLLTSDSNASLGTSQPEYPQLYSARDGSGMLLLAWTEANDNSGVAYQDIYFIVSPDNGSTWYGRSGQITSWPIKSGADGPGWLVNLPSETSPSDGPWLDNAYVQDNHLLFMYSAADDTSATPEYAQFSWDPAGHTATVATRIAGSTTCIGGGSLCPRSAGAGGFFTGDGTSGATIFYSTGDACGGNGDHVVTLESSDDGATWQPFSSAGPNSNWGCEYGISGNSALGPGGEIMGAFDNMTGTVTTNTTTLYFFKVS